ncbi:MAG TPA: VCBS repeat-containing protein, partial [Syntrophobacteraceae bacterium]|nr:VCBS repeat-containing protein [Syntrophobacteraceae bacterium]
RRLAQLPPPIRMCDALSGTGGYLPCPLSIVADLDLDGIPEVIGGNTVYRNDGSILWMKTKLSNGFNAVANLDEDPFPEIVPVTNGAVHVLDHTGDLKWGPVPIPGGGFGGPPAVADMDGDGAPEIGTAGACRYVVYKADGTILWQSVTQDTSSDSTGSTVFDFQGDGQNEVVYGDEHTLRIYRGTDGAILFQVPNSNGTAQEYPIVADVDGDRRAELVVTANNYAWGSQTGIRVFEDAGNSWAKTRPIWNQHAYHITNVGDDGTIPVREANSWEQYNTYRCNTLLPHETLGSPDITASLLSVDRTAYPARVAVFARIGNGGGRSPGFRGGSRLPQRRPAPRGGPAGIDPHHQDPGPGGIRGGFRPMERPGRRDPRFPGRRGPPGKGPRMSTGQQHGSRLVLPGRERSPVHHASRPGRLCRRRRSCTCRAHRRSTGLDPGSGSQPGDLERLRRDGLLL